MSEIKNYSVDFVERTKKLIEGDVYSAAVNDDVEVTLLMNCLLGLIVFVQQKVPEDDKNFLMGIDVDSGDLGFEFKKFKNREVDSRRNELEISSEIGVFEDERLNSVKDLRGMLTKMRHGIAHQHVASTSDSGEWRGIYVWNVWVPLGGRGAGEKKIDFFVYFQIGELKKFALKVAEEYLNWKRGNA